MAVTAGVRRFAGKMAAAGNARRRWTERRGGLLRLTARDGTFGWGEASPLPGYSPDDLEEAAAALEAWASATEALDALDLARPVADARRLAETLPEDLPSARFAVETAVLDLAARVRGVPLWRLLGGSRGGTRPVAALIDVLDPVVALERASASYARGVRTFKVKIGRPRAFAEELELLSALRRFGDGFEDGIELRLDANGALPEDDLGAHLRALAPFRPQFVEEPVSGDALLRVADPPVPLALDESLQRGGYRTFESWLRPGACAALVLKPAVLGGLLPCLVLARRAAGHGVGAVVSHTFGGPIAFAAESSLALALPEGPFAHGLGRHGGLDVLGQVDIPYLSEGRLRAPDCPGLGVDVEQPP
ncbi:MAG: enolase C-terminal domain-like protein [Acidobacteriota bacterium]